MGISPYLLRMLPLNVIELRPKDRRFVRPHGVGLLPAHIFSSDQALERRLALSYASRHGDIISVDQPHGYWRYDRPSGAITWFGLAIDSRAPVSLPPATRLPLGKCIAALARAGIRLQQAHLLHSLTGWSEKDLLVSEVKLSKEHTGLAGIFVTDTDNWQFEIYGNGMIFSETKGRAEAIASALVPLTSHNTNAHTF